MVATVADIWLTYLLCLPILKALTVSKGLVMPDGQRRIFIGADFPL